MENTLRWIMCLQFICVAGWQCPNDEGIPQIYVKLGQPAVIGFQATLQTRDRQQVYRVMLFNNSNLYTATFYNNVLRAEKTDLNSEFIGNAAKGNFTVKTVGVHTEDGGVYMLRYDKTGNSNLSTEFCSMLVVIGKPRKATVSNDNSNVLGRNSQLSCNSFSTTNPINHTLTFTYNWKVNDITNPSSTRYVYRSSRKTLTIMNVSREDAGKRFKCNATESGDGVTGYTSDYSDEFIYKVIYGPDSSTTRLDPINTEYTLNEDVPLNNITCIGDCYPRCNFKWTKPGTNGALIVSKNAVLSLGTLSRTEAATYTCEVTNANTTVRTERKQVVVHVNYGPDASTTNLTLSETTYTGNEGDSVNDIQCSGICYPSCNYGWTKSGSSTTINSATLSLGSLVRTEAGAYTCTVSNPTTGEKQTKALSIFVRYGPDACTISSASPLTLTEGRSSPTLSCESECYPSCSHTWSNISSDSPVGENGEFQLVKASRYQAGNYQCLCKNTATVQYVKNKTAALHIIIQYPPDVNVLLSTENITEGNTLTLSCDAKGVPSIYNYNGLTQTWNGTPVPNTHREVSGTPNYSSLHIPSLKLQDSGTYTCYVNNGVRTADTVSSVTVKVKVLPKILTHRSQFAGKTDGTVNVSVQFYSYPDIDEVVFKQHDNQTITNDTARYIVSHFETTVDDKFYGKDVSLSGMQANLVISNLKQEDFGSYTLILKNELGKTITPFTIDAESAPSAPTGFRYLTKAGTHTFTWFGGFNGGKLQTFIIQTSIAHQENWQNRTTVTEEMDSQNIATYWADISSLSPGTYSARLFAWNIYGKSDYVSLNSTFTVKKIAIDGTPFPVAAAIGGSLAGIAVLVISAVSFFIYKRRYGNKDGSQSRLNKGHVTAEGDSDDEDEVNTVNPMYISADEVNPGLSAGNTYAQPVKKNKHDIYALVDKKPKNVQDDLNNLYATPEKKGKEKPQKKEGLKKDKKGRKKKATDGDVYENAPEKAGGTESRNAYDENPYENPEVSAATQRPQKNVNKDGLIYADLTFNDQPKGQKKLVIHGLDSMTEYVEVDFTKKAEPLPESDEEK